jgi:hypothetical protein
MEDMDRINKIHKIGQGKPGVPFGQRNRIASLLLNHVNLVNPVHMLSSLSSSVD